MHAECYWCLSGTTKEIKNPIGNAGDPLATCKRCHVFVCGFHGERDHSIQEFHCFDCNKSIALASAIVASRSSKNVGPDSALGIQISDLLGEKRKLYKSWNEFKERNKWDESWVSEMERAEFEPRGGGDKLGVGSLGDLTGEAKMLLKAAAFIVKKYYPSDSGLSPLDKWLFRNIKLEKDDE